MPSPRLSNIAHDAAPGILPNGRLELLVRLVAQESVSLELWEDYVSKTKFGFPNDGEFRLFPLVGERLKESQTTRDIWIKEASSDALAASALNAKAKSDFADVLRATGVVGRWTKGTALAHAWYERVDLRPSGDVDVICNYKDLPALSEALTKAGWAQKLGPKVFDCAAELRGHGATWVHEHGAEVDVVWLPRLTFAHDPWMLKNIFADEEPIADADPTWLLIEAIDHGLSANRVWPIRWVVDCLVLLEHPDCVLSWDTVLEVAERYKMAVILLVGLNALERFSSKVPEAVLQHLRDLPTTVVQEQELLARLALDNPRDNFLVSRRYNTYLRAPLRRYRAMVPSPIGRERGQSVELRSGIALRNIVARVRYPVLLS